jgi:hypothetical protein
VTLGHRLKNCTIGLILALLPALEEDANEFFERVFYMLFKAIRILENVCIHVGLIHFYKSFWIAIYSTPFVRLSAINFLTRKLPKISSSEGSIVLNLDLIGIFGSETTAVTKALIAFLSDKVLLVNRGALDLLNSVFKMKLVRKYMLLDFDKLLMNALFILLKRDMSLNRRLFMWINDEESDEDLINTIIRIFKVYFN